MRIFLPYDIEDMRRILIIQCRLRKYAYLLFRIYLRDPLLRVEDEDIRIMRSYVFHDIPSFLMIVFPYIEERPDPLIDVRIHLPIYLLYERAFEIEDDAILLLGLTYHHPVRPVSGKYHDSFRIMDVIYGLHEMHSEIPQMIRYLRIMDQLMDAVYLFLRMFAYDLFQFRDGSFHSETEA